MPLTRGNSAFQASALKGPAPMGAGFHELRKFGTYYFRMRPFRVFSKMQKTEVVRYTDGK